MEVAKPGIAKSQKRNEKDDLPRDDSVTGYGPNVASSTVGESLPIACERRGGLSSFFSSRAGAFWWETRLVQTGPHLKCTDYDGPS